MNQHRSIGIGKTNIISKLRNDILQMQGFKSASKEATICFGLGNIEKAFPHGNLPTGVVHEFINSCPEHLASTAGFVSALLQNLMQHDGACLWISRSRTLFPAALQSFGISPDRIIFIDLLTEKEVLWATEEALKCAGLSAVVSELDSISFAQSRRLQLAVEHSKVTGFVLRKNTQKMGNTACAARWNISPMLSEPEEGLPGVGHPRWNVELLKVRNGNVGKWALEWKATGFKLITEDVYQYPEIKQQTG